MQSSSRSPMPQIGASVITSLYVVMTGRHESIHPFRRGPRSVLCDLKVVRSIFGALITLLQ
uniref:Uncharacterized protein n=1 Tax=Arundo donax TaxID=35708 RepID=A0A0A8ZMX4_ARUDO